MKRMLIGLTLAMAMVMGGCGTETTTTATVTDAGAATDTGSGTDSGTTTDAATTDAGATDTGGTTDTGSTKPDAGTTVPKCAANDNACLQACGTKKCAPELTGCNQDKGCSGLITCLNGCAQGVQPPKPSTPVSMPDGSTPTTCQDFCVAGAGKPAYDKLSTMQICLQGKCVESVPGKTDDCVQGTPDFNNCLSTCMSIECSTELTGCNNSKDCSDVLGCLNACGSDQSCAQGCQVKATPKGVQELNAMIGCMQSNCIKQ